eukprot:TRINITY_DN12425_c1_g3_i1.p1 TRINITY_DN12425_c1_g3~~TRINITY_DN12425_c1_g3_i1.p1  ORF type:complete len:533 (+),score=97.88 TRINITY_DN12425_c1_g3_i1:101-1600(+)
MTTATVTATTAKAAAKPWEASVGGCTPCPKSAAAPFKRLLSTASKPPEAKRLRTESIPPEVVYSLSTSSRELQDAISTASAARDTEDLVTKWREVCKPRRAGAVARKPRASKLDFLDLFDRWLEDRGLADALEHDGYRNGWVAYRYRRDPVVKSESHWETAFHGSWWYSAWLVLHSGVFLESDDRSKGHDFWEPGVYCTPNLNTARWYARPHILFGDGVYHRIIFELRVDPEKRIRNRKRGGVQWVFKPDAVSLHGILVQRNAPPWNGEERINDWDASLEARPYGEEPVPAVVNDNTTWSEHLEYQHDGEETEPETEDSVAPHLQGSNWVQSSSSTQPLVKAGCSYWANSQGSNQWANGQGGNQWANGQGGNHWANGQRGNMYSRLQPRPAAPNFIAPGGPPRQPIPVIRPSKAPQPTRQWTSGSTFVPKSAPPWKASPPFQSTLAGGVIPSKATMTTPRMRGSVGSAALRKPQAELGGISAKCLVPPPRIIRSVSNQN